MDYLDYAKGTGLRFVGMRYTDYSYIDQPYEDIDNIMADVKIVNPNATLQDLMYYFLRWSL